MKPQKQATDGSPSFCRNDWNQIEGSRIKEQLRMIVYLKKHFMFGKRKASGRDVSLCSFIKATCLPVRGKWKTVSLSKTAETAHFDK